MDDCFWLEVVQCVPKLAALADHEYVGGLFFCATTKGPDFQLYSPVPLHEAVYSADLVPLEARKCHSGQPIYPSAPSTMILTGIPS